MYRPIKTLFYFTCVDQFSHKTRLRISFPAHFKWNTLVTNNFILLQVTKRKFCVKFFKTLNISYLVNSGGIFYHSCIILFFRSLLVILCFPVRHFSLFHVPNLSYNMWFTWCGYSSIVCTWNRYFVGIHTTPPNKALLLKLFLIISR